MQLPNGLAVRVAAQPALNASGGLCAQASAAQVQLAGGQPVRLACAGAPLPGWSVTITSW